METEQIFTRTDPDSFLSGSGVDSFNVEGKFVSIGENGVQYLDTNKGVHPEVFNMEEPQKNDLRIYLREITGNPKLVCVNERRTHHYKIVDVIRRLSGKEAIRLRKRVTEGHFIALDMS
jgi:CTP-dependent riboflavin kinase